MRHLIKKQILELSLDKRVNYYHLMQQVSDSYWNEIVPLLEKSFDAVCSEDELMEIDQFELDLGVISEKDIGDEEWIRDIRKKIEEKIAAITDPGSPQFVTRIRDRRMGVIGQWLFYMEHGFLAWNTGHLDDKWYRDVLEALAVDFNSNQTLKGKILHDPLFLRRLASQHEDYFLHTLTEIITAEKQESLTEYVNELLLLHNFLQKEKKVYGKESEGELRNELWQNILRWASGGKPYPSSSGLYDELIRSFVEEKIVTNKIPPVTAVKVPLSLSLLNRYSGDLKKRLKRERKMIGMVALDLDSSNNNRKLDQKKDNEQISNYNWRVLDEEGIFIVNAGTVLLHPFLKSLFNRLELLKGVSFIDTHAQETSLYLIHYLGTGQIVAGEFELTIAKLLCGYPLEKPVEPAAKLSPEFTLEADSLLEAAISHWAILKNTSVAGLREGFLQRPGKLFSRDGNLYLQVEKKSIDVLLDYLPWNLGMIMLPWMKDILKVEWR